LTVLFLSENRPPGGKLIEKEPVEAAGLIDATSNFCPGARVAMAINRATVLINRKTSAEVDSLRTKLADMAAVEVRKPLTAGA
jgi:hypothetical protein